MADLSDGANWFEIDASNNKTSPNGWPEGMMPSGVNDSARADKGALKRFWDRINPVQAITPAGGVWTFTTSNPTYPTAYVDGEVYAFWANGSSAAGDQFRVNALAAKPIWRRGATLLEPIVANDIPTAWVAQLVYDTTANGGVGAFILLNPFVPTFGDGSGGIALAGGGTFGSAIVVTGPITTAGPIAAFVMHDSDGSSPDWQWYASGGVARLYSTVDRMTIDAGGNITTAGSIFAGAISAAGTIVVTGPAAVLGFHDRDGSSPDWSWYAQGGIARLWGATAGDRMTIDTGGNVHIIGTCTAVNFVGNFAGSGTSTINTGTVTTTTVNASGSVTASNVSTSSNVTAAGSVTGGIMHCTGTMQVDGQSNLLGTLNVGPSGGWARIDPAGSYNVTGSWLTFSDRRVKEDIAPYEHGLEAILALAPVQFRYRAGTPFADAERTVRLGLIAQDVEPVLPELVGSTWFGGEALATISPGNLVYALINAAKELAARVAALEAR
jgi:hypothetical protein